MAKINEDFYIGNTGVKPKDLMGKILWTNPNPLIPFNGQSITLNDKIENYKYYEITFIYFADGSGTFDTRTFLSTGKIKGKRTALQALDQYIRRRLVTNIAGTNMTFSNGGVYNSYGNEGSLTTSNYSCIPYQILGYK